MPIESYGSICIEGGDQLGKGDATSRMLHELESEGLNITFSSFPIYATPIGSSIRSLLKIGCPEDLLSPEASLDVRMALFALNRLEFMDVYLEEEKYKNTLLVVDRSPYSNAVTIGYGLSLQHAWDRVEVMKYIDKAMDYDSLMTYKLGLDRCVVQLKSEESEWKNIREKDTDQYEKKDVQERCAEVYGVFEDVVGSGWHGVVIKNEDGWRSRDDIWNDIDSILLETYGSMNEIKGGQRYDIGFREIVSRIYLGAEYDDAVYSAYSGALRENAKEIMYSNGLELGRQVVDSCTDIRFTNDQVREEFRRIVLTVPQTLAVLKYFLGEDFVDKLKEELEL